MTSLTLGGCDGSLYIYSHAAISERLNVSAIEAVQKMTGDNHLRLFKRVRNCVRLLKKEKSMKGAGLQKIHTVSDIYSFCQCANANYTYVRAYTVILESFLNRKMAISILI
jgi:hypothetical protein